MVLSFLSNRDRQRIITVARLVHYSALHLHATHVGWEAPQVKEGSEGKRWRVKTWGRAWLASRLGPAIHSIIITNTIATKQTERQRSQSGTTEKTSGLLQHEAWFSSIIGGWEMMSSDFDPFSDTLAATCSRAAG